MTTPPTHAQPDFSRIDPDAVLTAEGAEFVRRMRDKDRPPAQPGSASVLDERISRAVGEVNDGCNNPASLSRVRRELFALLERHGGVKPIPDQTEVTFWRWIHVAQADIAIYPPGAVYDGPLRLDLALAPLLAGLWGPASSVNSLFGDVDGGVDRAPSLLTWSAWYGWPDEWFEMIERLYDSPEPHTHRACREAWAETRALSSTEHAWREHLPLICASVARDVREGRDIEWGRSVLGAVPALNILRDPMSREEPTLGKSLLQTLDTLVRAGADTTASHAGSATTPLIAMLNQAFPGGPPLAARLLELRPELLAMTPKFEEYHQAMRSRLISEGDIDQANSVSALLMQRAATATTKPDTNTNPRPRAARVVI